MTSALVTLADANYLDQAKQFFSSVYHNNAWSSEDDCILLAHDVPKAKTEWFTSRGIKVFHCKPLFHGEPGGMSATLTSKFYLFTAAFKKYDIIIYSDADTSVTGNLNFLKRGPTFGSVEDSSSPLLWQFIWGGDILKRRLNKKEVKKTISELKFKYDTRRPAFCAGFFVFRPKEVQKNMDKVLADFMRKYADVSMYGDQLVFNLAFYNAWVRLPAVYNVHVNGDRNRFGFSPSEMQGIIYHYIGPKKPWKEETHYSKIWKKYRDCADETDMKHVQVKETWSQDQILQYSKYISGRKVQIDIELGKTRLEMLLGQIGIQVRYFQPKTFAFLKHYVLFWFRS